jgi:hypothetical protein
LDYLLHAPCVLNCKLVSLDIDFSQAVNWPAPSAADSDLLLNQAGPLFSWVVDKRAEDDSSELQQQEEEEQQQQLRRSAQVRMS